MRVPWPSFPTIPGSHLPAFDNPSLGPICRPSFPGVSQDHLEIRERDTDKLVSNPDGDEWTLRADGVSDGGARQLGWEVRATFDPCW